MSNNEIGIVVGCSRFMVLSRIKRIAANEKKVASREYTVTKLDRTQLWSSRGLSTSKMYRQHQQLKISLLLVQILQDFPSVPFIISLDQTFIWGGQLDKTHHETDTFA